MLCKASAADHSKACSSHYCSSRAALSVLQLTSPFMQHVAGGSTGNLRTASELALRGGAAAGGASDMLGDHHGYLLRMRLEGGLEGIELGPQLGRGSYGKVSVRRRDVLYVHGASWVRSDLCVPYV